MTLPVPRYSIGEKVYYGHCESSDEWYDCESCLGTMEWHVVTPAGEELDIECPACTRGYMCTGRQSRLIYRPFVRELTIGSVRIDTADRGNDCEPVSYMCVETGVGSGSIYYETMLADNRETAMSVAKLKAASQQEEMDERKRKNEEEAKKRANRNPSWHEKELRKAKKRIKELEKMVKEWAVNSSSS